MIDIPVLETDRLRLCAFEERHSPMGREQAEKLLASIAGLGARRLLALAFVGLVVLLAVFYLAWRAASPPRRLAVNMGPPAPVRAPVPNGAPNPQPLPGPTPKPPS